MNTDGRQTSRANASNFRWRNLPSPTLSSICMEKWEKKAYPVFIALGITRAPLPLFRASGGEGRGEEGQFRCVCPGQTSSCLICVHLGLPRKNGHRICVSH